jgi:hypothetical protein
MVANGFLLYTNGSINTALPNTADYACCFFSLVVYSMGKFWGNILNDLAKGIVTISSVTPPLAVESQRMVCFKIHNQSILSRYRIPQTPAKTRILLCLEKIQHQWNRHGSGCNDSHAISTWSMLVIWECFLGANMAL